MKRILVLCILFICVTGVCLGQTNKTRSLSVTTYYPSPAAVYSNIRLSPTNTAPGQAAGLTYYNYTTDKITYYNKTNVAIELPGSGGGGPDYWEYNKTTIRRALNNTNPNGTVIIGDYSAGPEVLEVNGDVQAYAMASKGFNDSTWFDIWRESTSNKAEFIIGTYPSSSDQYRFWLQGNPGILTFDHGNDTTPWLAVDRSGKVGIGRLPDPNCNLTIRGKTGVDNISQSVMRTEGDGSQDHYIDARSNTPDYGPEIRAYRSRGSLGSSLSPVRRNDTLLKMQGWGYNGATFKNGGSFQFSADGDFSSTSAPGKISFHTTAEGSTVPLERMVITSSGNVGINDTDPQYKLVVKPSPSAWTYIRSSDGSWQPGSDRRIKKNISGIENALEKILRVQGVRYDSIIETSSVPQKGKSFGFIAQDLETIFPELVGTDRKGRKSIPYAAITPVLVEAIKAQHEEIEALRKEINALKEWK
jgi:hypothetical protein